MESEVLYPLPHPSRPYVLLCSFALEGGACREARLDCGRVYPLPWRGQDNPLYPEPVWQEFSGSASLWEESWLVGKYCSHPPLLFILLNSGWPHPPAGPFSKRTEGF